MRNILRALRWWWQGAGIAVRVAVRRCPPPTAANRLSGTSVDAPRRSAGGGAQGGLVGRAFGRACMAPGSARVGELHVMAALGELAATGLRLQPSSWNPLQPSYSRWTAPLRASCHAVPAPPLSLPALFPAVTCGMGENVPPGISAACVPAGGLPCHPRRTSRRAERRLAKTTRRRPAPPATSEGLARTVEEQDPGTRGEQRHD
jgi:hypothetical protein